jgi:outer membrane receptor protein involved in Fe transport
MTRFHSQRTRTTAPRVAAALVCIRVLCDPAGACAQAPVPPPIPKEPALTDLSLEDLLKLEVATVFAASRVVQEVTRAPASVTVITRDEIRAHGYRTLADILRTVRGFYYTSDRNNSYAG